MEQKPTVGMGATRLMYTDRSPYTVIGISPSGREITVQEDQAIRLDHNGMSESQEYRYEPDPKGSTAVLTLRKNGRWIAKGEPMSGTPYAIGYRRRYYDYSF